MKSIRKAFLAIAIISVTLVACKKEPAPQTNLQLNVTDVNGNALAFANVTLYNSQSDYNSNINAISTQTTDGNGVTTFTNLRVQTYYYNISRSNDCSSNLYEANSVTLTNGITNNITTVAALTGKITLKNTTTVSYDIYVSGTLVQTLAGGFSIDITEEVTGSQIHVEVVQSGSISNPVIHDYYPTVTDCGDYVINF